jgi:dihydrofolate synthase / folylpolyglutamate synthase
MPSDSLTWLFGLEQFGIKFGLDNITAIVAALGHPERSFASVHVAGTNGKGSVTAIVDTALRAAGHRSARYTSPHLIDLIERFVIDGRPIQREALSAVVADVRTVIDRLRDGGRIELHPTFFEVTTAVAFELFRRASVEIAVCEVGLGGRLDATNVVQPLVTAITSIGLDHQQYLGQTLQEIAIEKAGILKPGVPVIVGKMPAEAFTAIAEIARDRGCTLVRAWDGVTADNFGPGTDSRRRMRLRTPSHDYGELELGLRGSHQVDNAVVAIRLLDALDARGIAVPPAAIAEGISHVQWPGRLDLVRLPNGREALLDAAHNADGAAALAAFLRTMSPEKPPLVFAAMRDKAIDRMLSELAKTVGAFVFTCASNPRSADPANLAARARAIAPAMPVEVEPSPARALTAAWRIAPRIVVAGSIFLIGDVLKEIGGS